jgi:hypothetical protein
VSSFKRGTLIAEGVRDLDAHQRRICDPDGYRPDRCPRCGHDVLHVHCYPERHPRGEPDTPPVVRVAQYMCAADECNATWRILPVLATDVVRPDRHRSRRSAVVNVKPAEHALDRDRLRRIDDRHRIRWYALAESLMRPTFVEVACILSKKRREMLVVDDQHMVKYLSARTAHERSDTEFMFGARIAVRITFVQTPCATRSNTGPNLSSRSRSSTAGASPSIVALRSCCVVHAWVG